MNRSVRAVWAVLAMAATLALAGCGEPLTAYFAAGHNPRTAERVLVLPFLDARTFRDPDDPLQGRVTDEAREVFVEVLKKQPIFADKEVLSPSLARTSDSLTVADALDYGRTFDAELVVIGQVFSYNETRAASIPPRAGLFVRIVSVPEDRLVYVGDSYQAAGAPNATGGRRLQMELVAQTVLGGYLAALEEQQQDDQRNVTNVVRPENASGPAVLLLPYHDRPNSNNLIEKTGGGEVVSSIYMMELAKLESFRLLTPRTPKTSAERLLTPEEAIALGREMGADFVVRGQVVEFRRAASVPSLYSAIISTAILAAQVLFAEMSGVDIATEVYRVEDGACIFARRDTARQKYVVQAERTVRRLASVTAPDLASAISNPPAEPVEPIIDAIVVEEPQPEETEAEDNAGDEAFVKEEDLRRLEQRGTGKTTPAAEVNREGNVAPPEDNAPQAAPAEDDGEDADEEADEAVEQAPAEEVNAGVGDETNETEDQAGDDVPAAGGDAAADTDAAPVEQAEPEAAPADEQDADEDAPAVDAETEAQQVEQQAEDDAAAVEDAVDEGEAEGEGTAADAETAAVPAEDAAEADADDADQQEVLEEVAPPADDVNERAD